MASLTDKWQILNIPYLAWPHSFPRRQACLDRTLCVHYFVSNIAN